MSLCFELCSFFLYIYVNEWILFFFSCSDHSVELILCRFRFRLKFREFYKTEHMLINDIRNTQFFDQFTRSTAATVGTYDTATNQNHTTESHHMKLLCDRQRFLTTGSCAFWSIENSFCGFTKQVVNLWENFVCQMLFQIIIIHLFQGWIIGELTNVADLLPAWLRAQFSLNHSAVNGSEFTV